MNECYTIKDYIGYSEVYDVCSNAVSVLTWTTQDWFVFFYISFFIMASISVILYLIIKKFYI